METQWKTLKLGEVLTLKRGYDLPASKRNLGNVPIFASNGITGYHSEAKIKAPGVITGRSGTLGKVFYTEEDFWPLNTTLYVQDFKGNDERYVSYLLESLDLNKLNAGSGVPTLNRNDVHPLEILHPNISIQKKIAEIIGTIDDKIELNSRINQTLEDIGMNIYKHLFVNFGPYLDGEFEDSELGMIPKGWTISSVYDLATYVNGMAFKQPLLNEQKKGLPVIKISELNANSISNAKYYEGNFQEKYRLNTGDVLFAWSASLGIYLWSQGEALLNQHIFNVQPNGKYSKPFLYFLLKNVINEFKEIAAARATTMGHITKDHLQSKYVPYPTSDVIYENDDIFNGLYNKILANELENIYLKQTRDYLLPRLLSGEIEFKEVEKNLEEVF